MSMLSKATVAATFFLVLTSGALGQADPSRSMDELDISQTQTGSLSNYTLSAGGQKRASILDTTTLRKTAGKNRLGNPPKARSPTPVQRDDLDTSPTPAPTGPSTDATTVHITNEQDFALLLPGRDGELIPDAESDGVGFCTPASNDPTCQKRMQDGFIRAAHISKADDGKWIQGIMWLGTARTELTSCVLGRVSPLKELPLPEP